VYRERDREKEQESRSMWLYCRRPRDPALAVRGFVVIVQLGGRVIVLLYASLVDGSIAVVVHPVAQLLGFGVDRRIVVVTVAFTRPPAIFVGV